MADAQRLAAAREAVNLINKNLKSEYGLVASFLGDAPREVETISSGSLALDAALGGGLAVGRLVEIYGPESSGKTTMALNAVANVQAAGDMAAFIDLENALDPSYARILGVNTDELLLSQPDHGEQAMDLITALIESQAFKIIVVDSVAALITKAEMENSAENVTIGSVARLLSTSLKRIVPMAARHGVTMVFINQLREKVGGFSPVGTPETTTGGRALKFYASQRVDVRRREQIKEGKEVIGNRVKLKIVKNKVAPPFRTEETVITFAKGVNRAAEMIEVGDKFGVINRPNVRKYVEVATGEVIGNSRAEAIERLEEDEELYGRLAKAFADAAKKKAPDPALKAQVEDEDEADNEAADDE